MYERIWAQPALGPKHFWIHCVRMYRGIITVPLTLVRGWEMKYERIWAQLALGPKPFQQPASADARLLNKWLFEYVYVCLSVCHALFDPFPLSQDFEIIICYYRVKMLVIPLFRIPKGQRSRALGQLTSFSFKLELLPQFLSQSFQNFRMKRPSHGQKIV